MKFFISSVEEDRMILWQMIRNEAGGFRHGRRRSWQALERFHHRKLLRSIPVIVIGPLLALFAGCLAEAAMPGWLRLLLRLFALAALLGAVLPFAWRLLLYLHLRGLVRDRPAVKQLLLDQPGMPEAMAEWLIARSRLIRGLLHAGYWIVGWIAAAALSTCLRSDGGVVLLAFLACTAAGLWMLVVLAYRALALCCVSIGLGGNRGPGSGR